MARNFLNRLPDSVVARVDGETIDVPIVARVYEYDLEALYASDVISEVEGKVPRRRWHRVIAPTWLIGRLAGQKPGHEGGTSGWLASSLEGQGISLRQPDAQGTPAGLGRSRL